jgi:hypothetical protein
LPIYRCNYLAGKLKCQTAVPEDQVDASFGVKNYNL